MCQIHYSKYLNYFADYLSKNVLVYRKNIVHTTYLFAQMKAGDYETTIFDTTFLVYLTI